MSSGNPHKTVLFGVNMNQRADEGGKERVKGTEYDRSILYIYIYIYIYIHIQIYVCYEDSIMKLTENLKTVM
jgi:hypothetical protein